MVQEGQVGGFRANHMEFLWQVHENILKHVIQWWLHIHMNVLKTIELWTLLSYSFTYIYFSRVPLLCPRQVASSQFSCLSLPSVEIAGTRHSHNELKDMLQMRALSSVWIDLNKAAFQTHTLWRAALPKASLSNPVTAFITWPSATFIAPHFFHMHSYIAKIHRSSVLIYLQPP